MAAGQQVQGRARSHGLPAAGVVQVFLFVAIAVALALAMGCATEGGGGLDPDRVGATGGADAGGGEEASAGSGGNGGGSGGPPGGLTQAEACRPSATRCAGAGAFVEVCTPTGTWTLQESCADSLCSDGACAGTCRAGDRRCGAGQAPEVCGAGGHWTAEEACPFVCGAGRCQGECQPGAGRCAGAGGLTPETCTRQGRWSAGVACRDSCAGGICDGGCNGMTCGQSCVPLLAACAAAVHAQSEDTCLPPAASLACAAPEYSYPCQVGLVARQFVPGGQPCDEATFRRLATAGCRDFLAKDRQGGAGLSPRLDPALPIEVWLSREQYDASGNLQSAGPPLVLECRRDLLVDY